MISASAQSAALANLFEPALLRWGMAARSHFVVHSRLHHLNMTYPPRSPRFGSGEVFQKQRRHHGGHMANNRGIS